MTDWSRAGRLWNNRRDRPIQQMAVLQDHVQPQGWSWGVSKGARVSKNSHSAYPKQREQPWQILKQKK